MVQGHVCNRHQPCPIDWLIPQNQALNMKNGKRRLKCHSAWHLECFRLERSCVMKIAQIKNLVSNSGLTWIKTLVLASFGAAVGLVLAVTIRIPVS